MTRRNTDRFPEDDAFAADTDAVIELDPADVALDERVLDALPFVVWLSFADGTSAAISCPGVAWASGLRAAVAAGWEPVGTYHPAAPVAVDEETGEPVGVPAVLGSRVAAGPDATFSMPYREPRRVAPRPVVTPTVGPPDPYPAGYLRTPRRIVPADAARLAAILAQVPETRFSPIASAMALLRGAGEQGVPVDLTSTPVRAGGVLGPVTRIG